MSTVWEEKYGSSKQHICELSVYLMTIVPITLDISMGIETGKPGHGKDVVDDLIETYEIYLRERMNRLSKNLTTTCEGLGMLHSDSNISTITFSKQCK